MTAATRTVSLLDRRPGGACNEIKTVRGVRLEKNVPIPRTHQVGKWKAVMAAMEVGESFVDTCRRKLDGKDKIVGREFTSRRLPDGRFRTWRTK